MDDLISRQAAIELLLDDKISDENKRIMLVINVSDEKAIDTLNMTCDRHAQMIKDMPPAQQTALTADDIETIRIHLSAFKEELGNQGRWAEAEEYERLIQRLTGKGRQNEGKAVR